MTAALLVLALAAGWTTYGGDPARTSSTPEALGAALHGSFRVPLEGRVTSQVLARAGTVYVATSAGLVYAVSERGYVRWIADLGQLAHGCPQLDGYGVTGTPLLEGGALYAADAFGRLHALDPSTGRELPGWPVRVVADYRHELVWGALLGAAGRVYLATGSYCDLGPMSGRVYAVDTGTRAVSSWTVVPPELGGGGGIWGWGGLAWSARSGSLYAVTGNALGTPQWAGYGERLVELSPDLQVRAASLPEPPGAADADFVGSPVLAGDCLAALRKDARLFLWRAASIAAGPTAAVTVEPYDEANPVLGQMAYDGARSSLVVVTGTRAVRVAVGADCTASVAWTRPLRTKSTNGSPTVAGNTVWLTLSRTPALVGLDAATGAVRARVPLGGLVLTAPTVADGRLFVGSMAGALYGFVGAGAPATPTVPPSEVAGHASRGWQSRDDGVWAGGRRIFPSPALTVLRTSAGAGLVSVGPGTCRCRSRQYWTRDGGRTWRGTNAVGGHFAGGGRLLFWRDDAGTMLSRVAPWPPRGGALRSLVVARAARGGRFADLAAIPGGVAALVTRRVGGQGWDDEPRILLWRRGHVTTVTLRATTGLVLARSIAASGRTLVVRGADFSGVQTVPVTWTSRDGGRSWTIRRG